MAIGLSCGDWLHCMAANSRKLPPLGHFVPLCIDIYDYLGPASTSAARLA